MKTMKTSFCVYFQILGVRNVLQSMKTMKTYFCLSSDLRCSERVAPHEDDEDVFFDSSSDFRCSEHLSYSMKTLKTLAYFSFRFEVYVN